MASWQCVRIEGVFMDRAVHLDAVGWICLLSALLAEAGKEESNPVAAVSSYNPFDYLPDADARSPRAPTPFDPHPGRDLGF